MPAAARQWKPPLRKRLSKSAAVTTVFSYLLSFVLRTLYITNRIERHIPPAALPYLNGEAPMVIVFWHGRLSMQPFARPKRRPHYVLISPHADGQIISAIMRRFGVNTVYGSSNRGARVALESLVEKALQNQNVVITPDGPRGPFQKAAKGAAFVAVKTGLPVMGFSFAATRHWRFKSWDKFMLPKPFGRIVYVVSEPLFLGQEDSDDAITATTVRIETMLNTITEEADRACGVSA